MESCLQMSVILRHTGHTHILIYTFLNDCVLVAPSPRSVFEKMLQIRQSTSNCWISQFCSDGGTEPTKKWLKWWCSKGIFSCKGIIFSSQIRPPNWVIDLGWKCSRVWAHEAESKLEKHQRKKRRTKYLKCIYVYDHYMSIRQNYGMTKVVLSGLVVCRHSPNLHNR